MIGSIRIIFEIQGSAGQTYRKAREVSVYEQRNGAPLDAIAQREALKFLADIADICGDSVEHPTRSPHGA